MIEVNDISKTYAANRHKAVDHLTWTIPDGSITGFIGPNGAGKSTTLRMITGALEPDEGTILINGINIAEDPLKAKRQFGFVPDSPDVFLRLKAIEYLQFMADIYHVSAKDREEFLSKVPARLDMASALNDQIVSMSHGMRQKVMVMGALISCPSVWILDEPMIGLDPKAAYTLKEMMREHAESGKSVVFSTHVLEVAEKLCDQICIINHGQSIFQGSLEELKGQHPEDSLETIFLDLTGVDRKDTEKNIQTNIQNGEEPGKEAE